MQGYKLAMGQKSLIFVNLLLELFKVLLSFLCLQELLVCHLKRLANATGDLLCLCRTAGQLLQDQAEEAEGQRECVVSSYGCWCIRSWALLF